MRSRKTRPGYHGGVYRKRFFVGKPCTKLEEKPIWLVEIVMPKSLISDIRTGSIEMEDQTIDLEDLDSAYEEDLDQQEFKQDEQAPEVSAAPVA